ncbi:class I SAM-dependent methyltransferase [Mesorhizobium qingshengii]|uniref:Methyltransferase domain-containing protein n=1 Tax=Mesorhizobium qingshengii TaxID=1165689 RepID=A0A1G5XGA0_9HYPH|nr:class I SAM-dependent methyltransferase [Mesorhizobium qingshengii]SDA69479.1 Methyltransferase domain-containing protein [Mesorhizobium qingshengii]
MASQNELAAFTPQREQFSYWAPFLWAHHLLHGTPPSHKIRLEVASCYDAAARGYDDWNWQSVWAKLEWPALSNWIGNPETVLEFGIGTGSVAMRILDKVGSHRLRQYVGVDLSEGMLEVAKIKLGDRVELIKADATTIDLGRKFDFVLMCRILGHVEKPGDLFRSAVNHLNSGGRVVVTDLDPHYPYAATRVPTPSGKMLVPTFKHEGTEVILAAEKAGLRLIHLTCTYTDQARALKGIEPPQSLREASGRLSNVLVFEKTPV